MTEQYAVIGHPIAHSKSPTIHTAFARQTQQDMQYTKLLAPLDGFTETVSDFFATGGVGLNVTLPFKTQALAFAEEASEDARAAGAANTLQRFPDGRVFADNTDGRGLLRDLQQNLGLVLQDKQVLLLGAGGAAQGVLRPLLQSGISRLFIANRTAQRAHDLINTVTTSTAAGAGGFDDIPKQPWDFIINATSAGLTQEIPPLDPQVVHRPRLRG